MAAYTIQVDEKTQAGAGLVSYLYSLGVIVKKHKSVRKSGLDEALEDVRQGRVYHAESVDDMIHQILG
ncbi:MAG: hypothetical protein ACI30J_03485 [Paludibacteraceae bacterium]